MVSRSGFGGVEAAEFVSPARPVSGMARKGMVSVRAASIFNVFIVTFSMMSSIIHQTAKKPSKKVFAGFSAT